MGETLLVYIIEGLELAKEPYIILPSSPNDFLVVLYDVGIGQIWLSITIRDQQNNFE